MVNTIHATNVDDALVLRSVEIPHLAGSTKPVVTFAPIISSSEDVAASTEHFEIGNLGSSIIMYFVVSNDKVGVNSTTPIATFVDNHAAMVVLDSIDVQIVVENSH